MMFVEVIFKLPRREYFKNSQGISLTVGEFCIVQAERGEDLGRIACISDHTTTKPKGKLREVLRPASEEDLVSLDENRKKEMDALAVCKEKVKVHGLEMKVVDVEYQFDGNKITFFFTAEERIDFRSLVKDLAATFRTRIELRQIGARDEARRFPGYGVCGKPLCCTSWLKEFEPVSLRMAKDQNLPLTPSKISGVCGRLMCCLSYELPIYKDIARNIPCVGQKIQCCGITAKVEKVDVFKERITLLSKDKDEIALSFDEIKKELAGKNTVRAAEEEVVEEPLPEDEEYS